MSIIKLDAIDSTNSFLKKLNTSQKVDHFTVVTAQHQTNGRGQMGAVWQSQSSKNLTFSVFVDSSNYKLEHTFFLSMATALAVRHALEDLQMPQLFIKWPNDILSQNKKICGILIENVMKSGVIAASVIGVGLNVNQTLFTGLPNASSLRNITGRIFDRDAVLEVLITHLKAYFNYLETGKYATLKALYTKHLYRKNKPSTFKNAEGVMFSGFIKTVLDTGELEVLLEDNITKAFALKDITLLY